MRPRCALASGLLAQNRRSAHRLLYPAAVRNGRQREHRQVRFDIGSFPPAGSAATRCLLAYPGVVLLYSHLHGQAGYGQAISFGASNVYALVIMVGLVVWITLGVLPWTPLGDLIVQRFAAAYRAWPVTWPLPSDPLGWQISSAQGRVLKIVIAGQRA